MKSWADVMRRDRHTCQSCGGTANCVHHRLLRSRGGTDDPFNLVALCQGPGTNDCHGRAHAHPEWAVAAGLIVVGFVVRGVYTGPDAAYRREYPGGAA